MAEAERDSPGARSLLAERLHSHPSVLKMIVVGIAIENDLSVRIPTNSLRAFSCPDEAAKALEREVPAMYRNSLVTGGLA